MQAMPRRGGLMGGDAVVSPLLLWMTERMPKQMRRVLGCPKPLRAEGPARGGHMLGVCYGMRNFKRDFKNSGT